MEKNNLIHARTCVYNVNYHIVWSTKYRKEVLTEDIQEYLKSLFGEIANDKGFIIASMEIMPDHVHVFVSAHPQVAPSYIVKMLKGISARRTLMKYPELTKQLWKGHLWNSSFYIETIGSISEDVIKKYIEHQKTRG
ncbi:IS200/IS605 family transposase [Thermoanaerobacterium sp. RBIITD]|uniref:IS200/IS605 family transposase n=1 Tax=Thermoanaerobacterium TaxID=28895 RepID=UPI000BB86AC9|nr:IS200/IS605 family transposase [Thermoanaerobacterium sp. RBIITD]SNX54111.1 putative transposase [Thermoanaerobacterium sp. RBIITD]